MSILTAYNWPKDAQSKVVGRHWHGIYMLAHFYWYWLKSCCTMLRTNTELHSSGEEQRGALLWRRRELPEQVDSRWALRLILTRNYSSLGSSGMCFFLENTIHFHPWHTGNISDLYQIILRNREALLPLSGEPFRRSAALNSGSARKWKVVALYGEATPHHLHHMSGLKIWREQVDGLGSFR